MKKIFLAAGTVLCFMACNSADPSASTAAATTDPSLTELNRDTPPPVIANLYSPAEGDVMLQNGKVMIYKNNSWEAAQGDVTLDNGMVVSKTGIVKKDKDTVSLTEGEAVSKSGNFFDKAGNAISTGWDKTKKGVSIAAEKTADAVKDAGKAIGKGAKKVGEKTKEIVTGDKK